MRSRPALALLTAGALLGAGCAADVAAGPSGALQERLDRGVAVEVTVEADPSALDDPDEAAELQDLLDEQAEDGALLVASRSGDGLARGLVVRGGDLEVRLVEDTAYLRADTETVEMLTDGRLPAPSPEAGDGATAPSEAPLGAGDPAALLAALDGGWVGVSGLTEDRLVELAGGDEASTEASPDADTEVVEDLLAARDLDDLDGLFTSYATVTGDGPWQVEVHARDLARALDAVATEADEVLGDDGPSEGLDDHGDDDGDDEGEHDVEDLPERVGGVTVEAADGVATRVVVDVATALDAIEAHDDEDDPDADARRARLATLADAGARVVFTMVDVGDRVDTPVEASVVDVAILEALLGARAPGLLGDLSEG